ncbi:hypothetical protein HBO37_27400 [Pseudomonas proteolytica]|uniref:hypothetical protein n=1 Tax=Pseudomonas proteolytica TaxID=219574 RepID=UPI001472EA12|nr:hypothetical protein [Pseudomonas proteolytica]NMZ09077.1 hypothetical protein [Pseudomonas proteolytica]
MKSMRVTPTRLFLILTVILSYITASGIWLIHFAPNLIGSSSEFEVVAGFFGVSVWLIASACLALSVIGLPATSRAPTDSMHIDDRVKMAANAKRYEWLRDVAFDTPRQDMVPRDKSGNMLIEQDLDSEIDIAMRAHPGEQEVEPCAD